MNLPIGKVNQLDIFSHISNAEQTGTTQSTDEPATIELIELDYPEEFTWEMAEELGLAA